MLTIAGLPTKACKKAGPILRGANSVGLLFEGRCLQTTLPTGYEFSIIHLLSVNSKFLEFWKSRVMPIEPHLGNSQVFAISDVLRSCS